MSIQATTSLVAGNVTNHADFVAHAVRVEFGIRESCDRSGTTSTIEVGNLAPGQTRPFESQLDHGRDRFAREFLWFLATFETDRLPQHTDCRSIAVGQA